MDSVNKMYVFFLKNDQKIELSGMDINFFNNLKRLQLINLNS